MEVKPPWVAILVGVIALPFYDVEPEFPSNVVNILEEGVERGLFSTF